MSRPKSLFAPTGESILSRADAESIAKKALSFATGPQTVVRVQTKHDRNTSFARSEITTARDAADGMIYVTSTNGTRSAEVWGQRFDDEGLKATVVEAESAARQGPEGRRYARAAPSQEFPDHPGIWAQRTEATKLEDRARLTMAAIDKTRGYVSAGSLNVNTESNLVMTSSGVNAYAREAWTRFTMGVRSPDNTGSGWAGQDAYDVGNLNVDAVAGTALDKCERSRNPYAVEPGRLVAVLEPMAYADMIHFMMHNQMSLDFAERGYTVFANPKGGSKVGLKLMDERLSLLSDPMDPEGPYRPFSDIGEAQQRTHWIKDGVLRDLAYNDEYAREHAKPRSLPNPEHVRLEAAASEKLLTTAEMVASCERGIYVSRTSFAPADFRHMTFSGVTRDGTWLIERGKITRPIKNFRFLESPLFFLNNLEAVGKPELVPTSHVHMVLPPVRVRDFNFTALADAV